MNSFRRFIELHDAELTEVSCIGAVVSLRFNYICVHEMHDESFQRCYGYEAQMFYSDGKVRLAELKLPFLCSEGALCVPSGRYDNLVPLDESFGNSVMLSMVGMQANGQPIEVRVEGTSLKIILKEPPLFEEGPPGA